MPFAIRQLISRGYYAAPAGDDGSDAGGGGTVDRGDDFKSPLDDAGKTKDKLDDPDEGKEKDKGEADKDKEKPDTEKEGEETDEEKAEREKAEAEAEAKKRIRIPKARFDEAQAKARQREQALQEEIARLKGGQQAAATTKAVKEMRSDIEKLQDKYEDLILDGKKEEARKVRRQVEEMRNELSEYQTNVKSDAARKSAIDEMTYNAQLAGMEAKYPALNPEHEDFDEEKTDEVATLLDAFVKAGSKRGEALAKAVKYVMGSAPAAAAKDDDKDDAAKKIAQERAAEARKKAAEAAKKQPADGKDVGLDSDKAGGKGQGDIDVMKLDQKRFAKLDDDTLAKLRGDAI